MRQSAKIIDVTRTFLPVDPQTFPETLQGTQREDYPEKILPVLAYEGYNFLPTSYGYKSFFGTAGKFDIAGLPARIDKLLIFESSAYKNYIVALTEEGIFTHTGNTADSWVHTVVLAAPAEGTHRNWSYCVIGNKLYCYRAQEASYWTFDHSTTGTASAVTPTFLNMEGQRGIFKAGGRLGMWDSEDSVAWSNLDDHADFEPSIETLAGAAKFVEVRGKISFIHSHGDGFIIYSTNGIVLVTRDLQSTFQWKPTVLMAGTGVAYPTQVAVASPDTNQYAYTAIGMHKIEGNNISPIIAEVTDLLQESLYPMAIQMLENRYLAFKLIESKFVEGLVQYESRTTDGGTLDFTPIASADLSGYSDADQAWIVGNGLTEEMQADFQASLTAAGISHATVEGFGTPVWQGNYHVFEDIDPAVFDTDYPNPFRAGFPSDGYSKEFTSEAEIAAISPNYFTNPVATNYWQTGGWLNLSDIYVPFEGVGSEGLFEFIRTQEQTWVSAEEALLNYFNSLWFPHWQTWGLTNGLVGTQEAMYPSVLTGFPVKNFTYTKCSCVGSLFGGENSTVVMTANGPDASTASVITTESSQPWRAAQTEIAVVSWQYTDTNGVVQTVPAAALCELTSEGEAIGTVLPGDDYTPPAVDSTPNPYPWVTDPIDLPDVTITLQDGDPGPIYPTYAGALIYDIALQKWGKMKLDFTELLDLSPINTNQGKIVTTKRFGIDAAASLTTGYIHRFDQKPIDSYIKYGKIGYQRLGMTTVEEVIVRFRTPCTGTVEVEASLDGRNPEENFSSTTTYTDATHITAFPSLSGAWHNVTLRGNYDIVHLEYIGVRAGKR